MSLKLGGYKRSVQWPLWLVWILAVSWTLSLAYSMFSGEEAMAEGAGPVYAIFVDRELRMLDIAEQESGWRKLALGYDESGEDEVDLLKELRATLDAGAELDGLDGPGHQARTILALRAGDRKAAMEADGPGGADDTATFRILQSLLVETEASEDDVQALADRVREGGAYAWEVWLLKEVIGEGGVESDVFAVYEEQNRRHGTRVILDIVGITLLIVLGVVLVPVVWWKWRRSEGRREARIISTWGVATVFGVFFGTELAADFVMEYLWAGITYCPWDLSEGLGTFLGMWGDTLWRILPVIFLMAMLFKRPSHMGRSFRLQVQGPILPIIAMVSVLWIWQSALYAMAGDSGVTDPTDFLESEDSGAAMLVFTLFSACLVAPVTEEIMCRGVLFLGLKRHIGPWPALLISSAIFGALHWHYDFFGIVGVSMMGVTGAALVWRTGSLFPAILMHALFNLIVTVHSYVIYQWPIQ